MVDRYLVPIEKRGEYYENAVNDIPPEYEGDCSKELVVRNEKDEEIWSKIIRPSENHLICNDL